MAERRTFVDQNIRGKSVGHLFHAVKNRKKIEKN